MQLGDERRRLAGRDLDGEPLDLLGDDRPHAVGLAGAQGEAPVGPVAQVVEVEHGDAVEPATDAVDGAGHGDVDDEQRALGAPVGARRRRG